MQKRKFDVYQICIANELDHEKKPIYGSVLATIYKYGEIFEHDYGCPRVCVCAYGLFEMFIVYCVIAHSLLTEQQCRNFVAKQMNKIGYFNQKKCNQLK